MCSRCTNSMIQLTYVIEHFLDRSYKIMYLFLCFTYHIFMKNVYPKYANIQKHKKVLYLKDFIVNGVHGGSRTRDRTLRRRMLYPAELRGHGTFIIPKTPSHFNHFFIFLQVVFFMNIPVGYEPVSTLCRFESAQNCFTHHLGGCGSDNIRHCFHFL